MSLRKTLRDPQLDLRSEEKKKRDKKATKEKLGGVLGMFKKGSEVNIREQAGDTLASEELKMKESGNGVSEHENETLDEREKKVHAEELELERERAVLNEEKLRITNYEAQLKKELEEKENPAVKEIDVTESVAREPKDVSEIVRKLRGEVSPDTVEEKELEIQETQEVYEDVIPVELVPKEKRARGFAPKKEVPMVPEGEYVFPDGFLWGTSTSGYQVEGGVKNDWSEWEISDKRLAELEARGEDKDMFICGDAVDHYTKYKEDMSLAKGLNNNAVRIGLEWARIQPQEDTWDVTAINHYREVLADARSKGLQTVVTLWHWTNPIWLAEDNGWENKRVVECYAKYVEFVIQELGAEVDFWITLNEPLMLVFGGYLKGYHPPGKHNLFKAEKVFRNLVKAHKAGYEKIHKHFPKAHVSITGLVNYFEPANYLNPIEQILSKTLHYFWNHRFLSKSKKHLDYIGVDYYFHDRIVWHPPFKKNKNLRTNDKGWELYPEGLLEVLKYLHSFKKPIYIMENGTADALDEHRENFIIEHLYYVHKAINDYGIDVRGYFHWSLLDNFEWSFGWEPEFGLYHVDRETMERIERPSAKTYRKICGENKVVVS